MSPGWITAFAGLWVVVIVTSLVLLGFLRRITDVLERVEVRLASAGGGMDIGGLEPGQYVPPFDVQDRDGTRISSSALFDSPKLVLFMSSDCGPCHELAGGLDKIEGVQTIVILPDDDPRVLPLPRDFSAFFQHEQIASDAFRNVATPHAFLVDEGGAVIDRLLPRSREQLQLLAGRVAPQDAMRTNSRKEVSKTS